MLLAAVAGLPAQSDREITVLANAVAYPIPGAFVDSGHLWVPAVELPKVNGFERRPEGLCAGDLCVPIPEGAAQAWVRTKDGQEYLDATAIAVRLDQVLVADATQTVFSAGAPVLLAGRGLGDRHAPDFTLQNRDGNSVALSSFRGKKVFLLAWASW